MLRRNATARVHPPSDSRGALEWFPNGGVPETDGVGLKAGHQFACPAAITSPAAVVTFPRSVGCMSLSLTPPT